MSLEIYWGEKFVPITAITELEEWKDYEIRFQEIPRLHRRIFTEFKAGNYGVINFQNFVGLTEIEGHQIRVKTRKFDSGTFEAMLNDVKNQLSNLPFFFDVPTFLPYTRSPDPAPTILYHNFAYLRYIMCQEEKCDRLESQIRKILYYPHRKLKNEDNYLDISRIHRVDAKTLYDVASQPHNLTRVPAESQLALTSLGRNLTSKDGTYYPRKVHVNTIVSSFDTPENRFVRHFLKHCNQIVKAFKEYIDTRCSEIQQLLDINLQRDMGDMISFLGNTLQNTLFSEVDDLTFLPIGSSVLQKREGYRNVLEYYAMLNMNASYNTLEINLQKVIQNKDIATLYEYWCFFKVKETLEKIIGMPQKAIGVSFDESCSELDYGLCLKFPNDTNLHYNKKFCGRKDSYSVSLRPDITLEVKDKRYLFDAKFRIDRLSDVDMSDDDSETSPESTFKKDDLCKMHTYRDAIKDTGSVFILYPGEEEKFYPKFEGSKLQLSSLEHVIQHLIFSESCVEGIGAISLRPSQGSRP